MSDNSYSSVLKVQINAFKVYSHCLPGKWTQIICDSSCSQGISIFLSNEMLSMRMSLPLKKQCVPF